MFFYWYKKLKMFHAYELCEDESMSEECWSILFEHKDEICECDLSLILPKAYSQFNNFEADGISEGNQAKLEV